MRIACRSVWRGFIGMISTMINDMTLNYDMQNVLILITDGSVNTRSHIGYGAYLAVPGDDLSLDSVKRRVKVKRFVNTSSTRLELQTLLWALSDIQVSESRVIVYTDSQNITGLPARRERLEQNDYFSKKNRRFNNWDLYQAFYKMIDRLDCEMVKVPGHQVSDQKDHIGRLFTLVDRASRKAMRADK